MTTLNISNLLLHPSLNLDSAFCQDWLLMTSTQNNDNDLFSEPNSLIEQYVDGKGLACPMPLLKLKMALKKTKIGNRVYVTATDPNSKRDIAAFCQHAGFDLWQCTTPPSEDKSDTIFHSIITKNC